MNKSKNVKNKELDINSAYIELNKLMGKIFEKRKTIIFYILIYF